MLGAHTRSRPTSMRGEMVGVRVGVGKCPLRECRVGVGRRLREGMPLARSEMARVGVKGLSGSRLEPAALTRWVPAIWVRSRAAHAQSAVDLKGVCGLGRKEG